MAVLERMPQQAIINGLKGVIDFYEWKGIPCARKWPVHRPRRPTSLEAANQSDFAYVAKLYSQVSPSVRAAYIEMATGTVYTGKDLFTMAYMKGIDYGTE